MILTRLYTVRYSFPRYPPLPSPLDKLKIFFEIADARRNMTINDFIKTAPLIMIFTSHCYRVQPDTRRSCTMQNGVEKFPVAVTVNWVCADVLIEFVNCVRLNCGAFLLLANP